MNNKVGDIIIMLGAVIGFVEFMIIGTDWDGQSHLAGTLHLLASAIMLISLLLYVSTWRVAWITLLRAIFAGFLLFMLVTSFSRAMDLL